MSEEHGEKSEQPPEQQERPHRRRQSHAADADSRESTPASHAEFGAATKIESAGYVIHDAVKEWVRREIALAASGIEEEERKTLNP